MQALVFKLLFVSSAVQLNQIQTVGDNLNHMLLPESVSETMAFSHCMTYMDDQRFLLVDGQKVSIGEVFVSSAYNVPCM